MIRFRSVHWLIALAVLLGLSGTLSAQELIHSTYYGGSRGDGGYTFPIVVAEGGDVYVAIRTDSSDNLLAGSPVQDTYAGRGDLLIARFSADLSELKASTYLGGTSEEGPWPSIDMVLDEDSLVVAFPSNSLNLPTTESAYQPTRKGDYDIGIARLSLDLSTIIACTYLGGSGVEGAVSVAITASGDVVVAGSTLSRNFPRTEEYPKSLSGGRRHGDVFVSILDAGLTELKQSRLLPGGSDDIPEALCVHPNGDLVVAGWTQSHDLASYEGSPGYLGGTYDGFVVRLTADLSITQMAFVGGSDWDFVYAMAVTPDAIAVAGHTASSDFETTAGAIERSYQGASGEGEGDDVFVTVLDNGLNVVASTYLGGEGWENATALVPVADGWALAGQTNSSAFLSTLFEQEGSNPFAAEGFLAVLNKGLTEATVLQVGGDGIDCPASLAVDGENRVWLLMGTTSTDLPIKENSWQPVNAGGTLRLETMVWSGDVWIGSYQLR